MRWLAAVLLVLPGCAAPDEPDAVFDGTLTVEAGRNAYTDFSLDKGEAIEWTWTSDQPVGFHGLLRCATAATNTAEPATSGRGNFTGTSHGCIAELLWTQNVAGNRIHITVTGNGTLLQSGTELGEPA